MEDALAPQVANEFARKDTAQKIRRLDFLDLALEFGREDAHDDEPLPAGGAVEDDGLEVALLVGEVAVDEVLVAVVLPGADELGLELAPLVLGEQLEFLAEARLEGARAASLGDVGGRDEGDAGADRFLVDWRRRERGGSRRR